MHGPTLGPPASAHTLVVGAGIAGVAVAHALAQGGDGDVLVVDERAPLTLTSAMSTECYRDWWPGPDASMVALMGRSIGILEDLADGSENAFRMNRRGYLFATADERRVDEWRRAGAQVRAHGGGELREHTRDDGRYVPSPAHGVERSLDGADLITDRSVIERFFPYLAPEVVAVLHARRCGWLSAQQLGMHLLESAAARGARFVRGRLDGLEAHDGRVGAARVDGRRVAVERVVIAAGPFTRDVAAHLGVDLPIECEPHQKVAFHDRLGAIPRDAPFLIWADPQRIPWSDEERADLARSGDGELATGVFPPGAHGRPEGDGDAVLMLWGHAARPAAATAALPNDPRYGEIVLRGWSSMIPALRSYFTRLPRAAVDGGYYARTPENRPLIGPLSVRGAFVVGALSGFGIMAACGAADLAARHVLGRPLPPDAPAFAPERYADPAYRELMREMTSGQL